jgi:butyrate response factor
MDQQRVYKGNGGDKRSEEPKEQRTAGGVELEVYNQGMLKTELCNKWEETGACPYGDQCQFAHGVSELRPVIRHPRYKTQVCRMVLAGEVCPYGHRCHFRHTLTPAERLHLPRP